MSGPGPLLASAHAELAKALAEVPEGKRGAAVAVVEHTGAFSVGWATRIGDDWMVSGEISGTLQNPEGSTLKIYVAGTW